MGFIRFITKLMGTECVSIKQRYSFIKYFAMYLVCIWIIRIKRMLMWLIHIELFVVQVTIEINLSEFNRIYTCYWQNSRKIQSE